MTPTLWTNLDGGVPVDTDIMLLRKYVEHSEARIVICLGVFPARISKPDDNVHDSSENARRHKMPPDICDILFYTR